MNPVNLPGYSTDEEIVAMLAAGAMITGNAEKSFLGALKRKKSFPQANSQAVSG